MRSYWLRKTLLLGCYLAGHGCLAQRGPISLLQPSRPAVALPVPAGMLILRREAAQAAAAPTPRPARPAAPGPLLLLNSRLIAGFGSMSKLSPDDIVKVMVYKGGDYPGTATPAQWRSLSANGIIDLTLKKKVRLKSQSLAQLGRHLQATEPVSYAINGLPVASGTLRIVTETIEELKIARSATGSTLSVWLFRQAGPSQSASPAAPHPPGPIMIRGTASR